MSDVRRRLSLGQRTRSTVESLCTVLAFDPGETTGWCAIGVEPLTLHGSHNIGRLHEEFVFFDYGQIDCVSKDLAGWFGTAQKHAGLNMAGENAGIEEMVSLACYAYPKSVVVVEDFIPDMNRMDQARHTLSPVRITAGFSFGMSQEKAGGPSGRDVRRGERLSDERIFIQGRSMPKTTCTDDRLKNWGLYDRNSGPHARDAVRHALYFLRTCRSNDHKSAFTRHLAWPHLFNDPADGDNALVNRRSVPKSSVKKELGEII